MDSEYFAEHDCSPLAQGEAPDALVHVARLLMDTGFFDDESFGALFESSMPPPPASRRFVEGLVDSVVVDDEFDCPICLRPCEQDEVYNTLPCGHRFHKQCIRPWLQKTCSCPMCRHEVATDDESYEEMKLRRKRQKRREQDVERLHNSMFG